MRPSRPVVRFKKSATYWFIFALPLLYRILPLPGASWSPRERLDAALVVFYSFVSARSVALPTPLLQYVNVLVSWFLPCPLGRRQVVFVR